MRSRTARMAAAAGLVLGFTGAAGAGQLVRFKTGFELQANAVRYEKEMVILTLPGGSEVGFPRWALEETKETFDPIPGAVGGYARNRIKGTSLLGAHYRPLSQVQASIFEKTPPTVAQGSEGKMDGGTLFVGFSLGGRQKRYTAGATGPVHPGGMIGDSVMEAMNRRRAAAGLGPQGAVPGARLKVKKPSSGSTQDPL